MAKISTSPTFWMLRPFIMAGYLQKRLLPVTFAYPILPGRESSPSIKEFELVGSRKISFSAVSPVLWNIFPPGVRWALRLLAFQKCLKTQAVPTCLEQAESMHAWSWLAPLKAFCQLFNFNNFILILTASNCTIMFVWLLCFKYALPRVPL